MGNIYHWAILGSVLWLVLSVIATIPLAFIRRGTAFWLKSIAAGVFPLALVTVLLLMDGEASFLGDLPLWYIALCVLGACLMASGMLALLNLWLVKRPAGEDTGDGDEP